MIASYSSVVVPASGGPAVPSTFNRDIAIGQALSVGLGVISWCIGLLTIAWFSIWMGMTSTKINIAILKTFWYTKILPSFCIYFGGGVLIMFTVQILRGGPFWLWPVVFQVLFIVVNLFVIGSARPRARAAFSKWSNSTAG